VTITISQLAATASLRTEVLAGHGGTDRIVNWAHVCELPEAWQWVGDRLGKAVKGIFQAPTQAPNATTGQTALSRNTA